MRQQPLDNNYLNIDLLIPDDTTFKESGLLPVSSLSIFDSNTDVFNKDGLFSNEIFGNVGSDTRMIRPGYIDLKVPVLHPLIYKSITSLGKKYEEIMHGRLKAKFDNTIKDFVMDEEGGTGYDFFVRHLDLIKYPKTESTTRDNRISLVEKYGRRSGLFTKFIVLPAGLRDYSVDDKGVPQEDGINDIYRKIVGAASRLNNVSLREEDLFIVDSIRLQIQLMLVEIYEYIKVLIDGKSKFIQSKWASRSVKHATANVITSTNTYVSDLNDNESIVGMNSIVVGLFQYAKALGNVAVNRIHNTFGHILMDITSTVRLTNPKTHKTEDVTPTAKTIKEWTTIDGGIGIINKIEQDIIKDSPVMLDGYYMALVKEVDKNTIEIITDTDYLDPSEDPKQYRPMTYSEMLYISISDTVGKYPCFVTRYPITGTGSIYPGYPYLRTTANTRKVIVKLGVGDIYCPEYPIIGKDYIRSMSPHYSHLGLLGGDFDGDTMSFMLVFSDESKAEIDKLLNSKEYYINNLGEINFSASINTTNIAIKSLTDE